MTIAEFEKLSFSHTLLVPLNTNFEFEEFIQKVITHNESTFVWSNGDTNYYPLIIAPVNEIENDQLYGYSKTKVMSDVLEYLSLINVNFGFKVNIHHEHFKNYIGLMNSVSTTKPFIPRTKPIYNYIKQKLPQYNNKLSTQQSLIVGLFRDAFNNENIFSSFLSYFKIFENYYPDHNDRNNWIDENFDQAHKFCLNQNLIKGFDDWNKFLAFVNYFKMSKGEYFYKQCRTAIAHAKKDPLINPNDFSHFYELYFANEVIKILAWYLILLELKDVLNNV